MSTQGLTQQDLEKVGNMLTKNYGITVRCMGTECRTDGKTIYLPAIAPEHQDEHLLTMVRSYLDHEAGHLVGESDFELFEKYRLAGKHVEGGVLNILEDLRCEQLMSDLWVGCGLNLSYANRAVAKALDKQASSKNPQEAEAAKHQLRQLTAAMFLKGKGMPVPQWVEPRIKEIIEGPNGEDIYNLAEIPLWADKTADLQGVMDRIATAYQQLFQEPPQPQQPPPQGEGEGEGDGEGKGEGSGEGKDGEGKGGGGGGQKEGGGGQEGGSGQESGQQPQEAKPGGQQGGANSAGSKPPPVTGNEVVNVAKELADHVKDKVKELPQETLLASSHINPQCFEQMQAPLSTLPDIVAKISDDASRVGGPIRQRLAQLLMSEARTGYQNMRTKGSPDPRRMSKLATMVSDRVMRRRIEHKAPDTAVTVLIDGSGSMAGGAIRTAVTASLALAEVVEACGHKVKCESFVAWNAPKERYNDPNICDKMTREIQSGKRSGLPHIHAVHKDWHQTTRSMETKSRFASIATGNIPMGGTPLGQAMTYCLRELGARSESRKVLLAMTDGQPDNEDLVKYAIKLARKLGVEVVLFGIGCDSVKRLSQDQSVVIHELEDLGPQMINELSAALGVGRMGS